jgi:hypothetical protein
MLEGKKGRRVEWWSGGGVEVGKMKKITNYNVQNYKQRNKGGHGLHRFFKVAKHDRL